MADFVVAVVAVLAFLLSVRAYFRDKRRDDETAELQRRIVKIEEARHEWEREERAADKEAARRAEEQSRAADFRIRFSYRGSKRTTGRIVARNEGQAIATGVLLDVWGERDGVHQEAPTYGGAGYHHADRLQPGESVHYDAHFTMRSPQPADLRYRITWTDGRGEQRREGRVPSA